jgi:DNA-binding NarL/FixJ family response regulator
MISVVLADDHHVVRQGIRALLEDEGNISVLGEAANGMEALQLVEELKPDVLVLDLVMGTVSGVEVTSDICQRVPSTSVVILSMHSNEAYVIEALKAGAKAYVLKDASAEELVTAIRKAVAGQRYLSSALSERAIDVYTTKVEQTALDPYDTLTARERQILHLVAEGRTSGEIAEKMQISARTVETHRTNLMRKLNVRSKVELVRYALQHGIVLADE